MDSPTTIARKPSETRIVESAQIDRQVIRDTQIDIIRTAPGLDDDQCLRYQCLALAMQCGPSLRIKGEDPDRPGHEYIEIADAFLSWVYDGTVA